MDLVQSGEKRHDHCPLSPWIGPGDKSHYHGFQDALNQVVLIDGCFNLAFTFGICIFVVVQMLRRSKLTWRNLSGLSFLVLSSALVGSA